jgi:hypothetical protein
MYLCKYRKQTNHVIKILEQWQSQISKYFALHKKLESRRQMCSGSPPEYINPQDDGISTDF